MSDLEGVSPYVVHVHEQDDGCYIIDFGYIPSGAITKVALYTIEPLPANILGYQRHSLPQLSALLRQIADELDKSCTLRPRPIKTNGREPMLSQKGK